jgi:large subunit ribosomal protein L9
MEVILKEDVANLGFRGEVVKVADGYARNYLLPRKLAMQATDTNKAVIEQMKSSAARRSAGEKAKAEEFAVKLDAVALAFTRKVGEAGHLFGSVTSADIAAELAAQGIEVDRRKIQLGDPLKSVGEFTVAVRLHREVTAHIKVKVQGDQPDEKKEPEHEKPAEPTKPAEPPAHDEATIGPPAEQTQFD